MSLLNPIQVQGYYPPQSSNSYGVGQYKLNNVKVMNPFLNLRRENLLVSTEPHLPQHIADMLRAERMARPQGNELPVGTESRMNVQDMIDQNNVLKATTIYKNEMNRIKDLVLTAEQKVKQEETLLLNLASRFPPRVVREAIQQSRSPTNPVMAGNPAIRQPLRSDGIPRRSLADRFGLMVGGSAGGIPIGDDDAKASVPQSVALRAPASSSSGLDDRYGAVEASRIRTQQVQARRNARRQGRTPARLAESEGSGAASARSVRPTRDEQRILDEARRRLGGSPVITRSGRQSRQPSMFSSMFGYE